MYSPPPVRREHSTGGKAPVRNIAAPYQKPSSSAVAASSSQQSQSQSQHLEPQAEALKAAAPTDDGDSAYAASSSTASETSSSDGSGAPNTHNVLLQSHDHSSALAQALALGGHEIDYRNYVFSPLESVAEVTFDKYCGPTPESNWVVPRLLLVGAYPASTDDEETLELISSILKEGVNKFVCLQQEVSKMYTLISSSSSFNPPSPPLSSPYVPPPFLIFLFSLPSHSTVSTA